MQWIRPYWLLALIFVVVILKYMRDQGARQIWQKYCDPVLLNHFVPATAGKRTWSRWRLAAAWILMVLALAGPSWYAVSGESYTERKAKIILLSLDKSVDDHDVDPSRLLRMKMQIDAWIDAEQSGQTGLIAYTQEPFMVAPLTEDGETICAMLPALSTDIMPIAGDNLAQALEYTQHVLARADFKLADLVVLTANEPQQSDIDMAARLAAQGITVSIMPVRSYPERYSSFQQFAHQGHGMVWDYRDAQSVMQQWNALGHTDATAHANQEAMHYFDQGRWLLLLVLFCLIPGFQKGRTV